VTVHPYLIDVLAALRARHDDQVWFHIDEIKPWLHRGEPPNGFTIIVDSKRRLVDDSVDGLLSPEFPGRLEPEHLYEVRWEDQWGNERCTWTEASSPALARLLVKAPANARVTEDYG